MPVNKFLLGCCYYPEHWDKEDIMKDITAMKNMGFNVIRMGEFSWSMYEKTEGHYDFSLLEYAVKCAADNGISVILGTPTAAPPAWLSEKYPEILSVNENSQLWHHGSRQHHNHTSEIYLEYCEKIVRAMAEHFKNFHNVIGWQIDNELNCHRDTSYAKTDDMAFREWLKEKYKTIENLNSCWGTRFWSLEYNDFSQIECPKQTPASKNPSLMYDFLLFTSDTVINYAKRQYKILKEVTPDKFITHNGLFPNIDYKKLTDQALDFISFDSYPAFSEKIGKKKGRGVGYKLSMTRGLSEKFVIMEQQSGPGGQISYLLPTPEPGQIRLWTYQSIAHGAVGILYFRYRTAVYGAEQLWYGIFDHDGKENYRSKEIRKISEEISRVGDIFINETLQNDVAIYMDYSNQCSNKVETVTSDDSRIIHEYLSNCGIQADMIYSLEAFKHKVLIIPHIAIATEEMAKQLKIFADNGSIIIISARSGIKDPNNNYYRKTPPGVFENLVGAEVEWFTSIPEHLEQNIVFRNKIFKAKQFMEVLNPTKSTPIAYYTERFCKGKPAFVKNGNVYYLGTYFDDQSAWVYADIIKTHLDIPDYNLDKDIEVFNYKNHIMLLNYSDEAKILPFSVYDLLTETELEIIAPYGVILYKK